jgi:hypothetical protein
MGELYSVATRKTARIVMSFYSMTHLTARSVTADRLRPFVPKRGVTSAKKSPGPGADQGA